MPKYNLGSNIDFAFLVQCILKLNGFNLNIYKDKSVNWIPLTGESFTILNSDDSQYMQYHNWNFQDPAY